MPTEKVKTNPKYQKKIDKSFAVIYHNLKRINDSKPTEAGRLEIMDPGSSSQFRKTVHILRHQRELSEVRKKHLWQRQTKIQLTP